jgi:Integrase core domain
VCVIDCCTREIAGWNLSHRCRTEDAPAAVEQAVLARLPEGSREANVTLTTYNGMQFTSSRFLETLVRLGITHRRTAYHHPESNSYIERFHRSLKEEEVWTAEYRSLEEARTRIAGWIEGTFHQRLLRHSDYQMTVFLSGTALEDDVPAIILGRGMKYAVVFISHPDGAATNWTAETQFPKMLWSAKRMLLPPRIDRLRLGRRRRQRIRFSPVCGSSRV